ncbi:MAG: histidine kinase [Gammaproteobacteria bacterium]|nr:histidine kinase [Gammaproteobacteria bacterium]
MLFYRLTPRTVVTALFLSSLLYISLAAAQRYGQTNFYNPLEHLLVFLYCLSSYLCLVACMRSRQMLSVRDYLAVTLWAGLLNSMLTTALWLGIRLVVVLESGKDEWLPSIASVLVNTGYTLCSVYLVVAGVYLSFHYLYQANQAELDRRLAERASADARLKLLVQQFTPHFLFNNLNVLAALISIDPARATDFVTKLARLYRFQIQHKDKASVPLSDELEFTQDYMDLMNMRFDDAYRLRITLDEMARSAWRILPGALQSLVENAVKHNVASHDEPLDIQIFCCPGSITVHNALRRRRQYLPSTRTGLDNIRQRYRSLGLGEIDVQLSEQFFSVTIPLMESKDEHSDH